MLWSLWFLDLGWADRMVRNSQPEYDVFLSHSHEDADVVETLAKRLEDEFGFNVWLDKWTLVPGGNWQQEMARGLEEAKCCAVCIGENTNKGWFQQEVELALHRQTQDEIFRVIPVLLPNANKENVFSFLKLKTWVDFIGGMNNKRQLHVLVCGIKGIAPGRGSGADDTPQPKEDTVGRKLKQLRNWENSNLIDASVAVEYQRKTLDDWMKET